MSLVSAGTLVTEAAARRSAVLAFNVIALEHAEAIAAAAESTATPLILAISENAVRYHGGRLAPITRATAALGESIAVPVGLHLDHVTDAALIEQAADCGYTSVMFDAGALPHDENIALTAAATARAHADGLWMEAELGYVGGKASQPKSAHAEGVRTDPGEAVDYVARTGVDALAVAVGSSHAMTTRTASLDDGLIASLREQVPVPLVLHGSSGVPDDALRSAIGAGIAKVNVGTALNIAMTGAVRAALDADRTLVDPRKYLTPARDAMTGAVAALLALLA